MTRRTAIAGALVAVALAVVVVLVIVVALPSGGAQRYELTGELRAHDPALVVGDGGADWFVYSTGSTAGDGNIQIRRSADGLDWEYVGEVWREKPEWLVEAVPGVQNLWAPELVEHDGTWYLYYSASTFGSNRSVIALATNSTLDPADDDYEWVDQGPVVESYRDDDFNAIDAGIVEDAGGTPYMAFGSFWSGIRMVELEWPSGLRVDDDEPLRLADRLEPPNAIEAPYIVERDGAYYLFVSFDSCCQGLASTYSIRVGRADEVTGPYLDRDGVPLLEGGGTLVLAENGREVGPGGQSVSQGRLGYHYYDGENGGAQTLAIRDLEWVDGWPSVPE